MKKAMFLLFTIFYFHYTLLSQYNEWTWMKGSPSTLSMNSVPIAVSGSLGIPNIANTPGGSYETPNWTDNNGMFWLLNEMGSLWRYNPTTNMWTMMSNPTWVDLKSSLKNRTANK